MRTSVLVAIALAATLGATTAYAGTVMNKDKKHYTVSLVEGAKTMKVAFKSHQTKHLCTKPCELKLGGSSVKFAKKTDTATIEGGKLVMAKK